MNHLPSGWLEFLGRFFRSRFCWGCFLRSSSSNRLFRNRRLGFRCRGCSSDSGNTNSCSCNNKSCCFRTDSCRIGNWTLDKSWFDRFLAAGYFRLKYRKKLLEWSGPFDCFFVLFFYLYWLGDRFNRRGDVFRLMDGGWNNSRLCFFNNLNKK